MLTYYDDSLVDHTLRFSVVVGKKSDTQTVSCFISVHFLCRNICFNETEAQNIDAICNNNNCITFCFFCHGREADVILVQFVLHLKRSKTTNPLNRGTGPCKTNSPIEKALGCLHSSTNLYSITAVRMVRVVNFLFAIQQYARPTFTDI